MLGVGISSVLLSNLCKEPEKADSRISARLRPSSRSRPRSGTAKGNNALECLGWKGKKFESKLGKWLEVARTMDKWLEVNMKKLRILEK